MNCNTNTCELQAFACDFAMASRFIERLTGGQNTPICLRLIDENKTPGHAQRPARKLDGPLAGLWPEIQNGQANGYGVFVVVNAGGHRAAEIHTVRAIFVDGDNLDVPEDWEWHLPPHFIVRRDDKHWHAYWLVAGLDVAGFTAAQRRLVKNYGTDPKVCDPSRVMRLPGTLHLKDPNFPRRCLASEFSNEAPYTAEVALSRLPEVTTNYEGSRSAPEGFVYDLPVNVRRAVEWLEKRAPAIEGQGGDQHTLITCHTVRDMGVGPETALDLLLKYWNDRCVPPWEPWKLKDKLNRPRQNEDGCEALTDPASTFTPMLLAQGLMGHLEASGPVSFHELRRRIVPPVQELVTGLLEKGTVTFLSAPGGSHKSRLALQWGLCIDAGTSIFSRAVEPARFVYLSYEDHEDEVTRRVQAIASRLTLPDEGDGIFWDLSKGDHPLAIVTESGDVDLRPFHGELCSRLKSIPGHKFIVVDGTYNVLRFAGAAKINETSVMAGIACLQRLCIDTDATILALWHPSQAGQERGDASGWSVAWHNAPRARLSLNAVNNRDGMFELKVEKRNHGPKGLPTTLYFDGGALLPVSETYGTDREDRLLEACVIVATDAARQGTPIQMQRRLKTWMLNEIEKDCGYRPPEREVKEILATAIHRQRLRYVAGGKNRVAGYYPFDLSAAAELAREAKSRRP